MTKLQKESGMSKLKCEEQFSKNGIAGHGKLTHESETFVVPLPLSMFVSQETERNKSGVMIPTK